MVIKIDFENNENIGVFFKLTNTYCIVPYEAPLKIYKILKSELPPDFPLIRGSVSGSRCLGRMIVGNSKGLILPRQTTSEEFWNFKKFLGDQIIIRRCNENLSALGNCIAVNDYSALIHPDINSETEELLYDVLGVEVLRLSLSKETLVGSFCIFNNKGGLVSPILSAEEQDELSCLTKIPFLTGTVNNGSRLFGSGIITNDSLTFCGSKTTQPELFIIDLSLKTNSKKF